MTSQSPAGLSTSFCNLFSLQEYNHLIKFILFMYFCHRYGNHKDNGNKNVSYPMILKENWKNWPRYRTDETFFISDSKSTQKSNLECFLLNITVLTKNC